MRYLANPISHALAPAATNTGHDQTGEERCACPWVLRALRKGKRGGLCSLQLGFPSSSRKNATSKALQFFRKEGSRFLLSEKNSLSSPAVDAFLPKKGEHAQLRAPSSSTSSWLCLKLLAILYSPLFTLQALQEVLREVLREVNHLKSIRSLLLRRNKPRQWVWSILFVPTIPI